MWQDYETTYRGVLQDSEFLAWRELGARRKEHGSAQESEQVRWGWPVRVRRCGEWRDSLGYPAARCEPSICAI